MLIITNRAWADTRPRLEEWAKASGHAFYDIQQISGNSEIKLSEAELNQSVLISLEADVPNLEALRDHHLIRTILPIREDHEDEDIERSIAYLDRLSKQDKRSDSIILDSHPSDGEEFHISLDRSDDRWKLIEDLGNYTETKPVFDGFKDIAKTIASELLTNAFYNAPQDANGNPLQPVRSEGVELIPPRRVEFSYGDDGVYIWIKVSDPFGTFNRAKLLKHLLSCADKDKLVVRDGVGGAGIGLFMVFKWAAELLFVFEPGQTTFVLVKLLKTKRMKIFDNQRAIFEVIERHRARP